MAIETGFLTTAAANVAWLFAGLSVYPVFLNTTLAALYWHVPVYAVYG